MTPPAPHVQSSPLKTTSCATETTPVATSRYNIPISPVSNAPLLTSPSTPTQATPKRPKLSLQTATLPLSYGKSSTGLIFPHSLSANPASSPTVRNTFSNAYEIPHRPSPASASPMNNHGKYQTQRRLVSPFPKKDDEPYSLPIGLQSILKNTSHPRSSHSRSNSLSYRRPSVSCLSSTNSPSPRERRRVFFPTTKKVAYRLPLAEEIKTVRFTLRHSDIPSSESPDSEQVSESETSDAAGSSSDSESETKGLSSPQKRKRQDSQRENAPRKIRLSPSLPKLAPDAERDDPQPATRPSRSHKRRRREWKWTLGAIPQVEAPSPLSHSISVSSSSSSTPTSSSAASSASRPKLGLNTSLAQSLSSPSSYTDSSELAVVAPETDMIEEQSEKKMPGENTPFPRSREGSIESTDDDALPNHQLLASLEDLC